MGCRQVEISDQSLTTVVILGCKERHSIRAKVASDRSPSSQDQELHTEPDLCGTGDRVTTFTGRGVVVEHSQT